MSVFKCKMCGGTLEINNNETVGVCEYCGTKQTLPKLDDDKKVNLYDRANHFRRNNDYDKAMSIYETILNEDKTDAEAYWSLVLCRYGIEYVEDPATHKRVPTVNRAQFTSVFMDEDYKSAIRYADPVQKSVYEAEAKAIDEIQKGILEISQKEEPFDVFICYKETDANGRRTQDSVLANDLYHQLTQEGFKVFFSRITLEDKLGQEYEPYIFAALNSAKVMVVLGTKPEYFNAVWVKNEWSRYLALIRSGAKKVLIPAYRDMDPYDLPEEFSHLQAQDMSKLGFMQDLLRGIKKITVGSEPKAVEKEKVVINNTNTNASPLLKRAFMFLEDGDWKSADEYCEKVLDLEPENARAYLGKLMAEMQVKYAENLKNCEKPFNNDGNYRKAYKFGDDKLKEELSGYIRFINDRNENARKEEIYNKAVRGMAKSKDKLSFFQAAGLFESIGNYKDSKELAKHCREKGEEAELNKRYDEAVDLFNNAKSEKECEIAKNIFIVLDDFKDSKAFLEKYDERVDKVHKEAIYEKAVKTKDKVYFGDLDKKADNLNEAAELFKSISGWKDADKQAEACLKEAEEIKAKKAKKKKIKIILSISIPSVTILIFVIIIILHTLIIPNHKYNKATEYIENENYDKACSILVELGDYKDAEDLYEKLMKENLSTFQNRISAGKDNTLGLGSDGGTFAKGDNESNQCDVSGWKDIVAVSAGDYHTVGLKADGTVVAIGSNSYGQCNVSDWKDIVAVSAGGYQTVGLKTDGTVVAVGNNGKGECDVSGWKDIVAVSAGSYYTVGLKSDGTVVATGSNTYGQCDVFDWKDIVAVSAGDSHTVGLQNDGTVVATGNNGKGQCDVSDWKNVVAVSAGGSHTVGLKSDGTVVATGRTYDGQCDVSDWKDIVAVSAGGWHTVGLKSDGTLIATGDNVSGQCDISDWKLW